MHRIPIRSRRLLSERPDFFINRHAEWLEIAWVAILIVALTLNLVIGPLTPLTFIVALPILILLRWEKLLAALGRCWPVFMLPAFALASAAWSAVPGTTLYYSLLYFLTVLNGIAIGSVMRGSAMMKGLFIGFAIYAVLTIMSGQWTSWNGPGGVAFRGLAGSKNSAGDTAGLTTIASCVMLAWAIDRRNIAYASSALLILPLAIFALWFSHATGALLSTVIAVAMLVALLAAKTLSATARTSIAIAAIMAIVVALSLSDFWLPALFDLILAESGKDAGLTGRADLWRKADQLIAEKPWLGLGYHAFWLHDNLDAEYLWRLLGIDSRMGFNFHNTFREISVHLGYVGLSIYASVAMVAITRLFIRTLLVADFPTITMTILMIFFVPKLPFEVIGFGDIHLSTVIAFAIFAAGYNAQIYRRTEVQGELRSGKLRWSGFRPR